MNQNFLLAQSWTTVVNHSVIANISQLSSSFTVKHSAQMKVQDSCPFKLFQSTVNMWPSSRGSLELYNSTRKQLAVSLSPGMYCVELPSSLALSVFNITCVLKSSTSVCFSLSLQCSAPGELHTCTRTTFWLTRLALYVFNERPMVSFWG